MRRSMSSVHILSLPDARPRVRRFALAVAALLTLPLRAQEADSRASAEIADDAAAQTRGLIAVNQAAGDGNAQANLAALQGGGAGFSVARGVQQTDGSHALAQARARIGDRAFSDAGGVTSVNQIAGNGNAQLNALVIGEQIGFDVQQDSVAAAADSVLAGEAARSGTTEGTAASTIVRSAVIDPEAFRRTQGVLQINQTAGVGNGSTNAILLQLPGGAQ